MRLLGYKSSGRRLGITPTSLVEPDKRVSTQSGSTGQHAVDGVSWIPPPPYKQSPTGLAGKCPTASRNPKVHSLISRLVVSFPGCADRLEDVAHSQSARTADHYRQSSWSEFCMTTLSANTSLPSARPYRTTAANSNRPRRPGLDYGSRWMVAIGRPDLIGLVGPVTRVGRSDRR